MIIIVLQMRNQGPEISLLTVSSTAQAEPKPRLPKEEKEKPNELFLKTWFYTKLGENPVNQPCFTQDPKYKPLVSEYYELHQRRNLKYHILVYTSR